MNDEMRHRRCTDCPEHSGMVAQFDSGKNCMERLEKGIRELRKDFTDHVNSSSKGTIAMLIGILMCFLTGVVGIYINSNHPKDKLSSQAEMTMLVKAMGAAIKEAKK